MEWTGPTDETSAISMVGSFPVLTQWSCDSFAFDTLTIRIPTLSVFGCTNTGTDCTYDLSACAALTSIDVSNNTAQSAIDFRNFAHLSAISANGCTSLGSLICVSNPELSSISCDSTVLGTLLCEDCTTLTNLDQINYTSLITLNAANCAFPSDKVDFVLTSLAGAGNTGGTCILTGSGMGAPTATGLAAKATLESLGWAVTTS